MARQVTVAPSGCYDSLRLHDTLPFHPPPQGWAPPSCSASTPALCSPWYGVARLQGLTSSAIRSFSSTQASHCGGCDLSPNTHASPRPISRRAHATPARSPSPPPRLPPNPPHPPASHLRHILVDALQLLRLASKLGGGGGGELLRLRNLRVCAWAGAGTQVSKRPPGERSRRTRPSVNRRV